MLVCSIALVSVKGYWACYRSSPNLEFRKCQSNCLDESIAAQSAKLYRLALNPEVIPSTAEDAFGCSGDEVSESKRIHQTVWTLGKDPKEVGTAIT